jgi:hypothetical protein
MSVSPEITLRLGERNFQVLRDDLARGGRETVVGIDINVDIDIEVDSTRGDGDTPIRRDVMASATVIARGPVWSVG